MAGPSNGGSRQFAGIRRVHLIEADRASRVLIAAAHEVDHGREPRANALIDPIVVERLANVLDRAAEEATLSASRNARSP